MPAMLQAQVRSLLQRATNTDGYVYRMEALFAKTKELVVAYKAAGNFFEEIKEVTTGNPNDPIKLLLNEVLCRDTSFYFDNGRREPLRTRRFYIIRQCTQSGGKW